MTIDDIIKLNYQDMKTDDKIKLNYQDLKTDVTRTRKFKINLFLRKLEKVNIFCWNKDKIIFF